MRRNNAAEWKIAVVGAGTMGLCIAQLFAMYRHEVNLYNRTPANLDKVMVRIRGNLDMLLPPVLCNSTECSPILKKMVEEGRLGLKTDGKGFYSYDDPAQAHRIRDEKYIKMFKAINDVNESMKDTDRRRAR